MGDFGPLGGVKITGFISPTDTNDTYAVIDTLYGIDGLRNLSGGTSALNSIPNLRRRAGMFVGVNDGAQYYKLNPEPWTGTISDWTELGFSGSSGTFSGLTDTVVTNPTDGDYLIYSGGSVVNLTQINVFFTAVNLTQINVFFTASTTNQTLFNVLPLAPISNEKTSLYVNGVKQRYNSDYNITGGTTVVWLTNKHIIDTDDEMEIIYI